MIHGTPLESGTKADFIALFVILSQTAENYNCLRQKSCVQEEIGQCFN